MTGDRPRSSWAISLANIERGVFEKVMPGIEKSWCSCNQSLRPLADEPPWDTCDGANADIVALNPDDMIYNDG